MLSPVSGSWALMWGPSWDPDLFTLHSFATQSHIAAFSLEDKLIRFSFQGFIWSPESPRKLQVQFCRPDSGDLQRGILN